VLCCQREQTPYLTQSPGLGTLGSSSAQGLHLSQTASSSSRSADGLILRETASVGAPIGWTVGPTTHPLIWTTNDPRSATLNSECNGYPELSDGVARHLVRLSGDLPQAFEEKVLHYPGKQRYIATWWSEDRQSVVWADGRIWREDGIDEDEWTWWTYTLAISNSFEADILGYDLDLPLRVLLLDLHQRRMWLAPIGAACDLLRSVASEGELESA